MQFNIPAVSPSLIMDVCKFASSATGPTTRENLISCFTGKYDRTYVNRAILGGLQLGLLDELADGKLQCFQRWKEDIRKASRDQLNLSFREALQDYPPFIVYAELLSKDYSSEDAAMAVHGILSIISGSKIIEANLRLWGIYAGVIQQDQKTKQPRLTIDTQNLMADYVKNLLESLESDFKAKIFVVDRLTNELYAYLTKNGIDIRDLVEALRSYENDPAESINKASKILEPYLHRIATDRGINVANCNGLVELADALRRGTPPVILKNQRNLCQGLGGIRNISAHGMDSETGKQWKVHEDAALASILLVPIFMRSIYILTSNGSQEL